MRALVACDIDPRGVARVTLDRPEKHNAFDDALISELSAVLARLDGDAAVRVVVLTGSGASFSAGADLEWMRAMAARGAADNRADALALAQLMSTLDGLGKPTVARVNGPAYGGGVGLIACCDLAIAADGARFAFTEVRLGLAPAVISPFVVAAIGARQARRLFATGDFFDAQTARAIGLVHEVVAPEALDARVTALVDLLLRGGPLAQREIKALLAMLAAGLPAAEVHERTADLIARLRAAPEGREGMSAFLEKRPPNWRR